MEILFVCEHGAAKSVVAAVHLNRIATEKGFALHATAFGTTPDDVYAPVVVNGLLKDGVVLEESMPQKVTRAELESAQVVVSFCNLPAEEYGTQSHVRYWEGVPPVSVEYESARDAILERLNELITEIQATG